MYLYFTVTTVVVQVSSHCSLLFYVKYSIFFIVSLLLVPKEVQGDRSVHILLSLPCVKNTLVDQRHFAFFGGIFC